MLRKATYLALAWMALLLAGQPLCAQTDTTATEVPDTVVTKARQVNKNLTEYQMQRRYRPVNQPFQKGGFLANSSVVITQAAYRQFNKNYSYGYYFNLAFDKWVNQFSGFRVSFGAGHFMDNYTATPLGVIGIKGSYLFNLIGFIDGYSPDRLIEFYPFAGAGFTLHTDPEEGAAFGLSAHLGVDMNMHVLPGVDLVVEPMLELQKDARGLARMDIWRKYLMAPSVAVGARIALDKNHYGADPGEDWYVTGAGGIQIQNSDIEWGIPIWRALGPVATVGAGRHYTPVWGLRLSGGFGWHHWKEIKEGDVDISGTPLDPARFKSVYVMVRFEGTADLLKAFKLDTPFTVVGLFGPEVGFMYKQDPYRENIKTLYSGLTLALQPKYKIGWGFSAFIEPRLSIVPYSAYAWQHDVPMNKNYYDAVMSLSLGVEYSLCKK